MAERAYTFAAPVSLAERIDKASAFLVESDATEKIAGHVSLALARNPGRFCSGDESTFVRAAVELFVEAIEKVEFDLYWAKEYEAAGQTDEEKAFIQAGRALVARRYPSQAGS